MTINQTTVGVQCNICQSIAWYSRNPTDIIHKEDCSLIKCAESEIMLDLIRDIDKNSDNKGE